MYFIEYVSGIDLYSGMFEEIIDGEHYTEWSNVPNTFTIHVNVATIQRLFSNSSLLYFLLTLNYCLKQHLMIKNERIC